MSTHPSLESLQGSYAWTDSIKKIHYGPGCVKKALPQVLSLLGGNKAFIVTGNSLRTKTDVVSKIESILKEQGAYGDTFSEIGEHAPVAGIYNGVKAFKAAGADIMVAVGGGSPVDAAKAMIYLIQQESGGAFVRQIAIPTTLSAAEYTVGAGFTNEQGQKTAVSSQELAPGAIILDAELTLATPERLWLSTGMRALDHAVENLYRPLVPLPLKALCYSAIRDLFQYLPASKNNPQDLQARQMLQLASWMSIWPLKLEKHSALGLSHSLGHKLGATYSIPHGITSCLTLSPVVAYKAEVASTDDKQCLAQALFYLSEPSTGSLDGDVLKLAYLIGDLVQRLGLKGTLRGYNVPKEDLPKIAQLALGEDQSAHSQVVKVLESIYD
ncbi:Dehydroquinate synthase-like protein [Leucogyrophana mollusca]|uniref:Dehydroquinate synthase-like protein n=1 Tax=Leucogyrophana mollusca TaxID=85980 RepID=A0ACB8BBV5_9AGAM|nr:Dehydroquinate synthase-like protein [Leucogyrophana mollusca]